MNTIKISGIFFCVVLLVSCINDDYVNINENIISEKNYTVVSKDIELNYENIVINRLQTSELSTYQLGQYTSEFGKTNAAIIAQLGSVESQYFGEKTQQQETNNDENETLISAKLHLPFFSTLKTQENQQVYVIDSIFGKVDSHFTINVAESNYFLSTISPSLQSKKVYYNDFDINTHKGAQLSHTENFHINENSVNQYYFDNPQTETDESTEVETVLSPRMVVDLDVPFFQEKIIDQEGSSNLLSLEKFQTHLKGIIIETSEFSEDFLSVLNLSEAFIELVYSYNKIVDNETLTFKKRVNIPLSGIFINKLTFNDSDQDSNQNTINLQGAKRFAKISAIPSSVIEDLKNEKAIITDAWISFEVDNDQNYEKLPQRLLLFNQNTGSTLLDYSTDLTASNSGSLSHIRHSPLYNTENRSYKVRINQHLDNILNNEGENSDLGLIIASNIHQISPILYSSTTYPNGKVPQTMALTPISVKLKNNPILHISYIKL